MAQITLPDVKLPDFKLPDGLRDMSREDIVNAAKDVHLPKMEMPDIDFSNIELPKQISDRMPGRRRTNPILPIAGIVAVGAMIAAAWWLITSPLTGPRVKHALNGVRSRMTGERTDLVRYDDEQDLGSLLSEVEPSPVGANGHSSAALGSESLETATR